MSSHSFKEWLGLCICFSLLIWFGLEFVVILWRVVCCFHGVWVVCICVFMFLSGKRCFHVCIHVVVFYAQCRTVVCDLIIYTAARAKSDCKIQMWVWGIALFIWTRGGTSSSVLSPQDPLCAPSEVHAAFVANNIMAKVRRKYVFVIIIIFLLARFVVYRYW